MIPISGYQLLYKKINHGIELKVYLLRLYLSQRERCDNAIDMRAERTRRDMYNVGP